MSASAGGGGGGGEGGQDTEADGEPPQSARPVPPEGVDVELGERAEEGGFPYAKRPRMTEDELGSASERADGQEPPSVEEDPVRPAQGKVPGISLQETAKADFMRCD